MPLKAVQELLGHATMDMTLRYAHLAPDVRRDAVQLLEGQRNMDATWRTARVQPAEVTGEKQLGN